MNLLASIGHTPLIRLTNVVPKNSAEVWVKYEGNNPTGSYKDRVALGVIKKAMARGDLKAGDRICEYTGGSTGTSIAFVSSILGLKFTAVSSRDFLTTTSRPTNLIIPTINNAKPKPKLSQSKLPPSAISLAVGSAEGSILPKYLPNAECPSGGTHWTPLRNLLFEFTDYGLQGTSLVAQGLHLRTQVGNF